MKTHATGKLQLLKGCTAIGIAPYLLFENLIWGLAMV